MQTSLAVSSGSSSWTGEQGGTARRAAVDVSLAGCSTRLVALIHFPHMGDYEELTAVGDTFWLVLVVTRRGKAAPATHLRAWRSPQVCSRWCPPSPYQQTDGGSGATLAPLAIRPHCWWLQFAGVIAATLFAVDKTLVFF
jgi:hypothetical protein